MTRIRYDEVFAFSSSKLAKMLTRFALRNFCILNIWIKLEYQRTFLLYTVMGNDRMIEMKRFCLFVLLAFGISRICRRLIIYNRIAFKRFNNAKRILKLLHWYNRWYVQFILYERMKNHIYRREISKRGEKKTIKSTFFIKWWYGTGHH